jgi:DNA polymerase III delta subunit
VASFPDWWTKQRGNDPKAFTYVCGAEPVLIEHIVQHTLKQLSPSENNKIGLRAGVNREQDIWAILGHLPIDPTSPRVVVIRDAEKLEHWEALEQLVKIRRYMAENHVIFVTNEEKLPTIEDEEGKKHPAGRIAALRAAHQAVIQVNPFTQQTARIAVEWVQSMCEMRPNVAGHLLNRAAGDLRTARDACLKLDALGEDITITLVNQILPQLPGDNLVDSLLKLEKREALRWMQRTPIRDIPRVIGQLDSQLNFLQDLNRMQANQMGYGEMMREMKAKAFLVKEFLPAAKHYDEKHVARRRSMLALVDASLRQGWPDAVLEAIVLNW